MNGKPTLYIDQHGEKYFVKTLTELKTRLTGKVSKMYRDCADGSIIQVGYVIGNLWLVAFQPIEIQQNNKS